MKEPDSVIARFWSYLRSPQAPSAQPQQEEWSAGYRRPNVKLPSDVFTCCPRCKKSELLTFEGEVFCLSCNWDSVEIHAEALAMAQLHPQHWRRVLMPVPNPVSLFKSELISRLFQPQSIQVCPGGHRPDAA